MEADVYPANKPDRADNVDGAIGEGSSFHELHGYYAQGVGPETATLPHGWQDRLISIKNANTGSTTGRCLEIHDLVVSKLVAARPKDYEFVWAAIAANMINHNTLVERLRATELNDCPSSNKWNRRRVYLMESFVPHFQFTRRIADSATDASRWSFS
jgi:hypothetical protein